MRAQGRPRGPRLSASAFALAMSLVGCSSLYGRSIDRGDSFAALGRWDDAAREYERAVGLEPEEREAREKLLDARHHQASERIALGRSLLTQGKPRKALAPLAEATRLEPSSREASLALAEARAAAIAEAKKELDAGNARQALLEAREILAVLPGEADAVTIEGAARTRIAQEAIQRARAFEADGKLGAAAVEYAEALVHRPDDSVARTKLPELRAALEARVTYHVLLQNFDGDPKADDLGSDIGPADLARGVDPKLRIRFSSTPPPPAGFTLTGMRLGGAFHDYAFSKSDARTSRVCDYVCGTDLVTNPEYGVARAELEAREADRQTAATTASVAAMRVGPLERAVEGARRDLEQERRELEGARSALAQCESTSKSPAQDCAALRAVRDQAQGEVDRAESDSRRAESELGQARADAALRESERFAAESAAARARSRFESTPPQISVDRHCDHRYSVDAWTEQASVELTLKGESLYDATPTLNEAVTGRFDATDETFPAEHGRCAMLEAGDPLVLPPETTARRSARDAAVASARARVVAAFQRGRAETLSRARTAATDGHRDEAVEAFVRYLLTETTSTDDGKKSTESVAGLLGVTPDAVRKATEP